MADEAGLAEHYGPVNLERLEKLTPPGTLYSAMLDAARKWPKVDFLEDFEGAKLNRRRLILGAEVLGGKFAAIAGPGERIGLMLPNVAGMAVVFAGMVGAGLVPAMLNFAIGHRGLLAAVKVAALKTVITSRKFIEKAGLQSELAALEGVTKVLFVEDIRENLSTGDKLKGALRARLPLLSRRWRDAKEDDEAVVLFTSGSEGLPKGVSLSHRNILANIGQIRGLLYFDDRDHIFNVLPTFHCFGLTVGLLLPIYTGFRTFLYPTPLHYKQIPGLIKKTQATVVISTDTFIGHWGRAAEPEDFRSLRLVVCGAERVQTPTRDFIREKFGIEILEGYGVTETSPVLAANDPENQRIGTVGRLLDGIEARIVPVPGVKDAGRLYVRGPNIMRGYYLVEAPGRLIPPEDGWHDTGDICHLTAGGILSIRGRAKRFAKIAGETVSLAAVEAMVSRAFPGHGHAVVSLPDPRKGEALVLVTNCPDMTLDRLVEQAHRDGLSELQIPKKIHIVEQLPVLSTGKISYGDLDELARKLEGMS